MRIYSSADASTSITVNDLPLDSFYKATVAAVNSKGAGDESGAIEFNTEYAVAPLVPTDLEVSIETD